MSSNLTAREQDKIVVAHYGFIQACAVKFWKRYQFLEREECISVAMLEAVQSSRRYNSDSVPFSMFVEKAIEWKLKNLIRNNARRQSFEELSEDHIAETPCIEDALDAARFVEKASASPILSRRLIGHTMHEIGQEQGVNKSTIMRRSNQEMKEFQEFKPE